MGWTAQLSSWLSQHRSEIFDKDSELILQLFEDWLGCLIAGLHEPSTQKILTLLNSPSRFADLNSYTDQDRAFIFGFASHCLELDDSEFFAETHPSSVIFSSLMARPSSATNLNKILNSAKVGFFSLIPIGHQMNPRHYAAGWHGTGTLGSLASTIANGTVLDFNEQQYEKALGIAATLMSGLQITFGTESKYLNSARAAQNGLLSSKLVALGLSSSDGAFEGFGGLTQTLSGNPSSFEGPDLEKFNLHFVKTKPFPTCHCLIPVIENLQSWKNEHDRSRPEIISLSLNLSKYARNILHYDRPRNRYEAFFSATYAMFAFKNLNHLSVSTYFDALPAFQKQDLGELIVATNEDLNYMDHEIELNFKNGDSEKRRFSYNRGCSFQNRSFIRNKFISLVLPFTKNEGLLSDFLKILDHPPENLTLESFFDITQRTFNLNRK